MNQASAISKEQALRQSMAASGAAIIAVIGIAHEYIGATLFPWAPVLLGPIGWHGLGLLGIVGGLLSFAGALRLIRFPVILLSLTAVVLGIGIGVFTAVVHHQFHLFAFLAAAAGATTAYFHRAHLSLVERSKSRNAISGEGRWSIASAAPHPNRLRSASTVRPLLLRCSAASED